LAQLTRSSSVRTLHVRNRIRFIGFFIPEISRKDKTESIFIFELPTYRIPDVRNVALGLYDRATIFLKELVELLSHCLFYYGSW
jgi:Fe2+ transport system protein B